jgi:hypothetical protein
VKPLGDTQLRLVGTTAVVRRDTGRGPTFTELARACRIESRLELVQRLVALHQQGYLTLGDEPGSLDVTPLGLALVTARRDM